MSQLVCCNKELAIKYGLEEATLLHNFIFWIRLNRDKGHNFRDGRTWTYHSLEDLRKLFPFWTAGKLRRIVNSCVKQGAICKGNYNKIAYDKTTWYALEDESLLDIYHENNDVSTLISSSVEMNRSNSSNEQTDEIEYADRKVKNGRPIPDSTPDTSPSTTPAAAFTAPPANKICADKTTGYLKKREVSKGEDNEKDVTERKYVLRQQYQQIQTDPKFSHMISPTDECRSGDTG